MDADEMFHPRSFSLQVSRRFARLPLLRHRFPEVPHMNDFPRTTVGGISLPRMIIGTNWHLGYSHTSRAKNSFIKEYQTPERMAESFAVFLENGIDAVMTPIAPHLEDAVQMAEDRTGRPMIRIVTPSFNLLPGGEPENEPERVFDRCAAMGTTICMPHQCVTDALVDRLTKEIRHIDRYTRMIRERGMIPGLSTHLPESIVYADRQNNDVETYIQIYNAAGFLMPIEADWVMKMIHNAKKPVMTIKPLAAGRLLPIVGLSFVWNTLRDVDMVTIGTTTPDEAREVIDLSRQILSRTPIETDLQVTRSKQSLL